jgi:phage terminase small subunit
MNPRQAIFYGEYIKDGNATRAAIAAGSAENGAHVAGARMLKNAKVAAAIEAWKARQCERLEITAERVLQELARLAIYDPGHLYDKDGNQIPVHKLDDVTRAAIAGVEDETETTSQAGEKVTTRKQKVKFADKGQNLERLGKYFKLFTDKVEHGGRVTLAQLVTASWDDGTGDGAGSQATR